MASATPCGPVSMPRAAFDGAGGFGERLRLGEDSELGLRLEFAGVRFVFADAARAIHRSRVGSYETWLRRCVEYGTSNVYIHEKLGRDPRAHVPEHELDLRVAGQVDRQPVDRHAMDRR